MSQVKIIGISGGSGSGKTTFLSGLKERIPAEHLALVSQDNYYKPQIEQHRDENGWINYDLPTGIEKERLVHDMNQLLNGNAIEFLEYNFNNPAWEPQKMIIQPAPIVVMEGLFVFHYDEIRDNLDYMIYLDAHHVSRLERRIRRDAEERGYPEHQVRYQWHNHVRPSEEQYLEPYKSSCQLVVDNNHSFEDGLNEVCGKIRAFLGEG